MEGILNALKYFAPKNKRGWMHLGLVTLFCMALYGYYLKHKSDAAPAAVEQAQ